MKNFKILIVAAFLILLIGCQSSTHETKEKSCFVVTSPLQQDTLITRNYVAQIRAMQHIEIRALEKGYLQKIYVDEGKYIQKGQLMFQIMPQLYEAEFQKTKAETSFADIEYQNTRQLSNKNVVSPNELALAKAKLDQAKAQQQLAQTHLQFTQIRAPFSGIMDHFQVRLGSLVNEGDWLTSLSDNTTLWVYFNVPEAEYLNYKTHVTNENLQQVQLQMANGQLFDQVGKVETIEADFNNETGNIAFRATFKNPKALLRHGETGTILMNIPLKNALLIPQKATFEVLEKRYVYVIDSQNKVHAREIKVALEMPDLYVVESGLKAIDRLLLEGIRKVKEGEKVVVKFENPQKVLKQLNVYVE